MRKFTQIVKSFSFLTILFALGVFLFVFPAKAASVIISPANVNVSAGSQLTVTVQVGDVVDLFGAAFDLMFDPAVLSFASAQKGIFLEQGAETSLLIAVNPPGDLIVGYSRVAVDGVPTGVNGSGNLMTLTFNALAAGTTGLTFQNMSLCDTTGSECNPIPTTWNNGNVTVSGTPPPTLDSTPPSVPTALLATAISSSQINLSWAASTDNVGVTGYRIYRSGTQVATSVGTAYSDTGLNPSTAYSYTVSAYDAAGNTSPQSSSVAATTQAPPPTPPPSPPPSPGGGGGSYTPPPTGGSPSTGSPPTTGSAQVGSTTGSSSYTPTSTLPTSTIDLLALLKSLQQQLRALIVKAVAAGIKLPPDLLKYLDTSAYIFTKDLTLGVRGDDVYNLQLFLIAKQTGVSAQALKHIGATGFFGPLTRVALAEYQKANGITPAVGYFGPKTRGYVNGR